MNVRYTFAKLSDLEISDLHLPSAKPGETIQCAPGLSRSINNRLLR